MDGLSDPFEWRIITITVEKTSLLCCQLEMPMSREARVAIGVNILCGPARYVVTKQISAKLICRQPGTPYPLISQFHSRNGSLYPLVGTLVPMAVVGTAYVRLIHPETLCPSVFLLDHPLRCPFGILRCRHQVFYLQLTLGVKRRSEASPKNPRYSSSVAKARRRPRALLGAAVDSP